jgi:hypothetical protein
MVKNILYYGSPADLPNSIRVQAGPCSAVFEPDSGFLRYLSVGTSEVLRGIYAAVRDRNWDTIPGQIHNLEVSQGKNEFQIEFHVSCKKDEIQFEWQGRIIGERNGNISYRMDGLAKSTFEKNRIGFCILHPASLRGKNCTIQKIGGEIVRGAFPHSISPHQPFKNLFSISHKVARGLTAEVRMEGDVFEMEDQRNWTDASYKTYCTPLELPFPVEVEKGTRISQTIKLLLHENDGPVTKVVRSQKELHPTLKLDRERKIGRLTEIGLQTATHSEPLTQKQLSRLKALNLSHLRVDLDLSEMSFHDSLRRASDEAGKIDVPLEIATFISNRAQQDIDSLCVFLKEINPKISRWLIFHQDEKSTSEQWVTLFRESMKRKYPSGKFASGTNAYFAELNRDRPKTRHIDQICYSINPQVHAFDNASLVETLEAQGMTVESCRQFSDGNPIIISPVTLKPRFNPNATGPEPAPIPGELPSQVDVRQMSLLGAGWTLGSVKSLGEAGVQSATYYETAGWRGVQESPEGPPLPEKFFSIPGSVYPLYHVLADLGDFRDGEIAFCESSDPLAIQGLFLEKDDRTSLLIAFYSPETQSVRIENLGAKQVIVRSLNEKSAEEAMRNPEAFRARRGRVENIVGRSFELRLLPFSTLRIDLID